MLNRIVVKEESTFKGEQMRFFGKAGIGAAKSNLYVRYCCAQL